MKRILSALLFFAALNSSFAIPTYDPFADAAGGGGTAYTVGLGLAPNNQFVTNDWQLVNSGSANLQEPTIVATNLTYSGLPVSTGNAVSNSPPPTATGRSARLNMRATIAAGAPGAAAGIAYYSFLLQVTDLSMVPTYATNNFIAGFSDGVVSQGTQLARCGGRLVTRQSGTGGYYVGIGKGTVLADYVYDTSVERAVGEVVFVVVSYERSGGATNVNLWVNPPGASFGATSAPTANVTITSGSGAGDMNSSGIASFVLSCQQVPMPSCVIDEVRVATNWGFVTGGDPTFPVAITANPASRNVKAGDRVAFVVGNSGTSPTYQWRLEGTNISGATDVAYAISSAQASDAGSYSVVVSNVLNSLTSAPAALTVSQAALQLYETNLIVVRVGDGAQPLANTGNSIFLDQLTTNGTYVNTVYIPDTGVSALIQSGLDLQGSVLNGAAVTRSADKRLLTLAGYNCERTNTTRLDNTTAASVPRGIVTIDASSQVSLVVSDNTAYSGTYMRGATTDGTNNFWGAGGAGGTYYFGSNAPTDFVQTTWGNTRSVDIFNGNLYALASASGANGLVKYNGLPVTNQGLPLNILSGFNSTTTTDFSVDPTDQLIYVTSSATIIRWQYDGSISGYTNAYSTTLPGPARYLAVDYGGAAPVIYATTGDGQICRIEDTGPSPAVILMVSSGPNQLYKGIRFGPAPTTAAPAQPTLSYERQGNDLVLSWTGTFTLLSATNVAGPYLPVSSATSPYTNNMTSPSQLYFGLGNP